jgi:hypothetical protein
MGPAITHRQSESVCKPVEHAAAQRFLLQYRKRLNEVENFVHKVQELRVFLRKLIQLCEVPRLLCRPRWA